MRWGQNAESVAQKRRLEGVHSTGPELDRKYWIALVLYGILGLLVWFTMGEDKILVQGRPVELKLVPLVVLGGLALRTVLALQAEKIKRGGDKGGSEAPKS
jgi:hypothetical protein